MRTGEENINSFLENAPDAMFIHDIEGKILALNNKAEELFDIKSKDYIGKNVLDIGLVGENRLPTIIDGLKEIKKGKANKPVEIEFTNKKGSRVIVEVTGFPITRDGKTQACDIIRDVTKLKRRNKAPAKKSKSSLG